MISSILWSSLSTIQRFFKISEKTQLVNVIELFFKTRIPSSRLSNISFISSETYLDNRKLTIVFIIISFSSLSMKYFTMYAINGMKPKANSWKYTLIIRVVIVPKFCNPKMRCIKPNIIRFKYRKLQSMKFLFIKPYLVFFQDDIQLLQAKFPKRKGGQTSKPIIFSYGYF